MKKILENKVLVVGLATESFFLLIFGYLFYYKRLLSSQVFGSDLIPQTPPFIIYYLDLITIVLVFVLLVIYLKFIIFANRLVNEKRKLTESLSDRQQLISIAAHELSAPLTNIKGTLSILSPRVSQEYQKFADRALISIEELIKLIGDILTVSRFEMGKIKVTPQPLNIEEIFQEVINQFKGETDKMRVSLVFQNMTSVPQVLADPQRIREVIINLVSNGLKYGLSNGPTLLPDKNSSSGTLIISTKRKGNMLIVSVSDNGPGIKAEDLAHLFNRFVRLPSAQGQRPGTGLGLYISRLIVESHGGKIWAESRLGEGTTFSFSLPVA